MIRKKYYVVPCRSFKILFSPKNLSALSECKNYLGMKAKAKIIVEF